MAHGTKYRSQYKDDKYGVDIQVDLQQEDYAGSVTSIKGVYPALSIEWPSDRDNIFDVVRGSIARFSAYAEVLNQFDEFFDAYEKQWKMVITIDSSIYWSGWVMVGDHIESYLSAPYVVTFMAYDLGYLQDVPFDNTREEDDSIIDVLEYCLTQTGLGLNIKERVNLYEDSINDDEDDSMFDQINVHQTVHFDEDWEAYSCYEVLERELKPLNAFLMQEHGVWNICRVHDMKYEHNYRVIIGGSVDSSGTEDTTKALSGVSVINRSGLMMAVPTWKNLNFFQEYGLNNLVHNGRFGKQITLSDFWTVTGTGTASYVDSDTVNNIYDKFTSNGALRLDSGAGTSNLSLTHIMQYAVESGSSIRLEIRYRFAFYNVGGSGTAEGAFLVDNYYSATNHRVQLDGTWGATNTDTDNIAGVFRGFAEGSFITDPFGGTGSLILTITDVRGITGASSCFTFWDYFEVIPIIGSSGRSRKDYSEELNANNITEPEEVVIIHGDSEYTATGRDVLAGSYETSAGATTDVWQSKAGSEPEKVAQLCANCYKVQRESSARRFQATIKGQLSYLTVLYENARYYLSSAMTYLVDQSEWQGERIEIKTGWGDDITGTFLNGFSGSNLYDTFSTSANELNIEKTTTPDTDYTTLSTTSVTAGTRYLLEVNIVDNSMGSTVPDVTFAGTTKTGLDFGDNSWEVVAATTTDTHPEFTEHTAGEFCDITLTVTIKPACGI